MACPFMAGAPSADVTLTLNSSWRKESATAFLASDNLTSPHFQSWLYLIFAKAGGRVQHQVSVFGVERAAKLFARLHVAGLRANDLGVLGLHPAHQLRSLAMNDDARPSVEL
jgi:hypothetical protein